MNSHHEFAQKQGIILMQTPTREYQVLRIVSTSVMVGEDGTYYTYLNASFVPEFGPDTWTNCQQWLVEHLQPLPPELAP